MVQAFWICNFPELFEVTDHGGLWDEKKTKAGSAKGFKNSPLSYVRFPVDVSLSVKGVLSIAEKRMELKEAAGIEAMPIVEYIYWRMVGVAAFKMREYRGWVLTGRLETMDVSLIAKRLDLDLAQVVYSLPVLEKFRWIALKECEFAVKCAQPVRFGAANVDFGNISSSRESPENLGNSGAPYKPNTTIIKTLINTEDARARGGEDESLKMEEESVCLNPAAAEESESESVGPDSVDRKISESVGPGSEESVNTAGSSRIQSLEEASCRAEPNSEVVTSGQSLADGVLDWDVEISKMDVERDDPNCLLKGLSENRSAARERLIHCAVIWMQHLCPWLRPGEAMNYEEEKQREVNVRAVDTWANKAWNRSGEDGVIEVIVSMRKLWKQWKKPMHSGIRNPMGVWVKRMMELESNCVRQDGIEQKS